MSTIFNHDAAGLEVVQTPYVADLEVSTKTQFAQGLEVVRGYDGLEVVNNGPDGIKTEGFIQGDGRSPRRKKLWLIVGGVVLLLVVVAAVVGGVLGSRHSHKTPAPTPDTSATPPASSSSPSSSSSSSDPPPSNPPNAVYASSGIGVTGWWTGSSSFTIRLIYQGEDGNLRLMRYHSGDGKWSTLATLTGLNAKRGSPIAASCFNIPNYFFSPVTSTNVSPVFRILRHLHAVSNAA